MTNPITPPDASGSELRFCVRCGAERVAGARFCGQCGADFGGVAPVPIQRSGPSPRPWAFLAGVGLLAIALGAAGVYALTRSPSHATQTASASIPATEATDAGRVICQSYSTIEGVATGDAVAVAQAFIDHAADLDIGAVAASAGLHAPSMITALDPVVSQLAAIRYPANPDLLVDLRAAAAAFEVTAADWERFARTGQSYVPDFDAGMSSLNDAKAAVLAATDQVNRMEAAGSLSC